MGHHVTLFVLTMRMVTTAPGFYSSFTLVVKMTLLSLIEAEWRLLKNFFIIKKNHPANLICEIFNTKKPSNFHLVL